MAYSYDQIFAADPANPSNIAQNASITIFAPGDGTMTPIAITDPDGQPLANPIPVNANGFGSAFMADIDRVAWLGGGFTGFFTSYEGMKQVALDAQAAAETAASTAGAEAAVVADAAVATIIADADAAATSAASAAGSASASATAAANSAALVNAPADTAIAAAINGTGATKTALNSAYVPKWKATTAYAAGESVVSPSGDVVTAKVAFTSGASYSAANWNLSASYARPLTQLTVAYLGDSQVPATTYVRGVAPHWAGIARSILGMRYADGVYAGIGGQTSTQIAARVTDVTASNPSICMVDGGVNDLAAGTAASVIIANLQTIINALVAKGIKPVILTALPSVNINTPAKLAECTKLNDWIKALPSTQGVNAIDWRPGIVDFASTTAAWKAGLSTDGIHPNDIGHTVLGRIVAAGLAPLINAPSPMLSDAGTNASLLSLNPGMTGSGGVAGTGVTGTVPASWDVGPNGSTTTTASVEARADDVGGNWLKLDVTAGAPRVFQQNTAVGVDWNVGDTVWAEVELYIPVTPVNFRGAQLSLDFWNGLGGNSDFTLMQASGVVSPVLGSEDKYVLRTKAAVIPASTGRLQMFLYLNNAGIPTYTVRVGRMAIRKQI